MLITAATSADEAERGATVALLPVGSFEQHGDHLPLQRIPSLRALSQTS
jgi:creatinine amidohydrolase